MLINISRYVAPACYVLNMLIVVICTQNPLQCLAFPDGEVRCSVLRSLTVRTLQCLAFPDGEDIAVYCVP